MINMGAIVACQMACNTTVNTVMSAQRRRIEEERERRETGRDSKEKKK